MSVKNQPFTSVNNRIFDMKLTNPEFRVLMFILKWYKADKPLSYSYIATGTQNSKSGVQRTITSLINKNLITVIVEGDRRPNKYRPHSSLVVTKLF